MPSHLHECDVLVVGAGPAGIAAACAAAESGRRVVVLDHSPWLGGQIWRGDHAQPTARRWRQRLSHSGAQVFLNATAFAAPAPHCLLAETLTGLLEIHWQTLLVATGARELFLPFPGWTLPGVLGPGGLEAMTKAGWPLAGKRVVVAGTGPLLLAAADGLKRHGARIRAVAEQAPALKVLRFGLRFLRYPGKLAQAIGVKVRLLGVPYRCDCWPLKAEGDDSVRQVTLTDGVRNWTEPCDYLACGFHLVPNLELPLLLGCEVTSGAVRVNEFQETTAPNVFCAGEPTGVGGVERAIVEGQIAGLSAAGRGDHARSLFGDRAAWDRFRRAMDDTFALRAELRSLAAATTVICRCEDVLLGALAPFSDWRSAKLHTRCGMGACQGRICGAALQFLRGWVNDSVRPPVFPVSVGSLMGAHPLHEPPPNPGPLPIGWGEGVRRTGEGNPGASMIPIHVRSLKVRSTQNLPLLPLPSP